jgi:choline kinase
MPSAGRAWRMVSLPAGTGSAIIVTKGQEAMKAVMLAAGLGLRLGRGEDYMPKVLLQFGGETLLRRHVRFLQFFGFSELVLGVGHQAEKIYDGISDIGAGGFVRTVHNPEYHKGAMTTLWALREEFRTGEPVVFMDADVLYDHRLMARLIESQVANCFLMDRNVDPGEDPVRLCFRNGRLVDFHKRPTIEHDTQGEWIGFLKLTPEMARRVPGAAEPYIRKAESGVIYEPSFRDLLLSEPEGSFGVEDITGLPWIEIDFEEDLVRAESEILPRLEPLPS